MAIKISLSGDRGFTLMETLVALIIFITIVTLMIPVFLEQRMQVNSSRVKTEAVAFSQEILDELRQADIASLPSNGSTTRTRTVLGEPYNATITYCEDASKCSTNSRQIKVQVSHYAQTVYTVETVYTRFQ
jgi:type II secretory pathway pseudopilin PulG